MGQLNQWAAFSQVVATHIQDYVLPQYGDVENEPATDYDAGDCIKQSQRYLARFNRQSRTGEELLDIVKAAHWLQKAYDRIAAVQLPSPEAVEVTQAIPFDGITHYAHRNAGGAVFIKTAEFFRTQGGLTMNWGLSWIALFGCENDNHARMAAEILFDKFGEHPVPVEEVRRVCADLRPPRKSVPTPHAPDGSLDTRVSDGCEYPRSHLSDGQINEITMDLIGQWPSFEAQSWACKVAHAVLVSIRAKDQNEEDARVVRLAVEATICALGGDPNAFVSDNGHTVLDLTLYAISEKLKAEASK